MLPRRSRRGRRGLPPGAAAILATLVLSAACARRGGQGPPPNVLLLVVDAMRADVLGVNGYRLPTTPSLDRLAADGTTFRAAYAAATWTKPSMGSLLTCLEPAQLGFELEPVGKRRGERLGAGVLAPEITTLAEVFQAGGYRTAAFVNQVHLRPHFGFDQGFETYAATRGRAAHELNAMARAWLEERDRRPFFLYLHYLDAHWPYTNYDRSSASRFGRLGLSRRLASDAQPQPSELAPADLAALRARYDAEIAKLDGAIGRFLAALETSGNLEETIVAVTADHGEAFGEHGRLQHGTAPYQELAAVPLLLRLPEGLRGVVPAAIDEPVAQPRLMPTLLDLAGLEPPADCRHRSLTPLLRGRADREPLVFTQGEGVVAARSRAHTLLLFPDDRLECFDRAADPAETRPAAEPPEGPCRELAASARDWREVMARQRRQGPWVPLSPEEVEELQALGYL